MSDEKKILVDEDWKSQVQAEKEEAPQRHSAKDAGSEQSDPGDVPFPPASFDLLLTMLATETMVALGHIPHPVAGTPQLRRNHAKYLIDTIDVLREKTKGNLTPDEQLGIDGLLHQLRLAFVESASGYAGDTQV